MLTYEPYQLRKFASKVDHSSTILLPAYKKHTVEFKLPEKLIPRDVRTRWNSTYEMLSIAVEYRKVVDAMCADRDLDLRKYELTACEWTITRQLTEVLKV